MAVIPIIQQTWDTTSYVNPTRMNNIETNLGILSKATGIEYSTGVSVKDKIDEVEGEIPEIADNLTTDDSTKALSAKQGKVLKEKIDEMEDGISLLTIPANTYNTWTLALQALYVEYNKLTTEQKKRCSIIRNNDIVYKCSAISSAFTSVYAGSTTLTVIQSLFLQNGIYLNHNIEGATISSTSLSNTTQHQKIELRLN